MSQARFAGVSFVGKSSHYWVDDGNPFPPIGTSYRKQQLQPESFSEEVTMAEGTLEFLHHILSAEGLDISAYRLEPLVRRISACLRAMRVDTVKEAHNLLLRNPMLLSVATNALLIGTTGFFRDRIVFDEISHSVLSVFKHRLKSPRVWSVACSDGSELHSIALMLEQLGLLKMGNLLGTDCRESAIRMAHDGVYPSACLDAIPEEFHPFLETISSSQVRMPDAIRSAIQWQVADALTPREGPQWDMILCRNFSIYLDSASAATLWQLLEKSLCTGGFLVVGKAEKPKLPNLIRVGHSLYQKAYHDADF